MEIQKMSSIFQDQKSKSISLRNEKYKDRLSKVLKIKTWIKSNRSSIKEALYADFKKPSAEVDITEIIPVLEAIREIKANLKRWMMPRQVPATLLMIGTSSHVSYEPKGVSLIIAPWNFPFNLVVEPLVHALAAGNTAILKPSEITPATSALINKMVSELFAKDEVAVFEGGPDVSNQLLKFPFDHIFFTGSPRIGKIVMKAAAENLASVTLELGGKSPAIIDQSANIKDAALKIAWGKFINNGQTCIAPDYILIHKSIEQKFLSSLKEMIVKLFDSANEGIRSSPDYARMVSKFHARRSSALIKDSMANGAKLVFGESNLPEEGYISPTVLSDLDENAKVMEEEIFGPILPVVAYDDLEEAIRKVNSKEKPLALYIFSKKRKSVSRILRNTSSGTVCINDTVIHFAHSKLPFGGVNQSGFGKAHGRYGFQAFSNQKPILKQRVGFTIFRPLYPPYNKRVNKILDWVVKFI